MSDKVLPMLSPFCRHIERHQWSGLQQLLGAWLLWVGAFGPGWVGGVGLYVYLYFSLFNNLVSALDLLA